MHDKGMVVSRYHSQGTMVTVKTMGDIWGMGDEGSSTIFIVVMEFPNVTIGSG